MAAAFFPQGLYSQDRSFTPLFRLLDEYDSYSQGNNNKTSSKSNRASSLPHWQPSVDVRETTTAYELYVELPGVSKEHVGIDFTDPQTLQIRGKSERRYTTGTSQPAQIEDTKKNARKVTVEDEEDEEWSNAGHSAPGTPTTSTSTAVAVNKPAEAQKPVDNAKYWLAERKIGEFSRSFSFPNRVDQDGVRASFQDGILSIVVPKAKKHETRRIFIS